MSEARCKVAAIKIPRDAYRSLLTCWTCKSIDCIQWKLDECQMFRPVPFRLKKSLSQVERSSSLKPGQYSGWNLNWQACLCAQQWKASTMHWRHFFTTSSQRELLRSVTLSTQLMSYPRPWSSPNSVKMVAIVASACLALKKGQYQQSKDGEHLHFSWLHKLD